MIGAVVKNNIVENLIVLSEGQVKEMSTALGCEIVDARPYGLKKGDLRTDAGWTRNAGGEQMVLSLLEQKSYDGYSLMATRVVELENAQSKVAEKATEEALDIITGVVTE